MAIQDMNLGSPQETSATKHVIGGARQDSISFDPRTLPSLEKCSQTTSFRNVLVISGGGRGLTGAVVAAALREGCQVSVLAECELDLPRGVELFVANRNSPDFEEKTRKFLRDENGAPRFEVLVDCGGSSPAHARQDLTFLASGKAHVVFISDDLVYAPGSRSFPTLQDDPAVDPFKDSRCGMLRAAELEFINSPGVPSWTILRPTMILNRKCGLSLYPPCVPRLKLIAEGRPVPVACEGRLLVQPIAANDLADIALKAPSSPEAKNAVIDCAGPVRLEFIQLCRLAAKLLEKPLVPAPADAADGESEEAALCHRIYPLPWPYQTLPAPTTTPLEALNAILM